MSRLKMINSESAVDLGSNCIGNDEEMGISAQQTNSDDIDTEQNETELIINDNRHRVLI